MLGFSSIVASGAAAAPCDAAAWPQAPARADAVEETERRLAAIERSIGAGDAAVAERMVAALADDLAASGGLEDHRARLVRAFARARFSQHWREPDPRALLAGAERVDRRAGQVELALDGRFRAADGRSDADVRSEVVVHPLTWTGRSLEVEFAGRELGAGAPVRVLLGLGEEGAVQVCWGLLRADGRGFRGGVQLLAPGRGPARQLVEVSDPDDLPRAGAPFRLGLRCVGGRELELTVDGRRVARTRLPAGRLRGRIGVDRTAADTVERVRLAGTVDTGWLSARAAEQRSLAFARWLRTAGLADELPEPLRAPEPLRVPVPTQHTGPRGGSGDAGALPAAPGGAAVAPGSAPTAERAGEGLGVLGRAQAQLEDSLVAAALRVLDDAVRAGKLAADDPAGSLLRVQILLRLGRIAEANDALGRFDRAAGAPRGPGGEHWEVTLVRAELAARRGRLDEALAGFDRVLAGSLARGGPPRQALEQAAGGALRACLAAGERRRAVERFDALPESLRAGALARFAGTIRRIRERGPSFGRVFESRTAHYVVRTDVDAATAVAVAQELERARTRVTAWLARGARTADGRSVERMHVHVFGTRGGYASYANDLAGGAPVPPHTDGLYGRATKELLLRMQGDRARLLRTARHEGLHQVLDTHLGGPSVPVWYDEGCAQVAERPEGAPQPSVDAGWRARADDFVPLGRFLWFDAAAFYRDDPGRNYAQAEALVRFLRSGDAAVRGVEERMLRALTQRLCEGPAATEYAVASLGLDELSARFERFVRRR